jgi:hypothetical protein
MDPAPRAGRFFDLLWLFLWGIASSAWCVSAAGQLGPTFDEPGYISRGLDFWRTGSHRAQLKLGTMPLPMDLASLPLYLYELWHGTVVDSEAGGTAWIWSWTRATTLLFWWVLLVHVWLAARILSGPWGGRLAVALVACEPCFLAHASLATSDIAVTACLVAFAYYFRVGRQTRWTRRVALPALWFGAALLCKASALVFGPLCATIIELHRFWSSVPPACRLGEIRRWLRDGLQISGLGVLLAFLYCGSDWQPEPSFVTWARGLPEGQVSALMVQLSERLCIFSNAAEALVRQIGHNLRGHSVFLLGQADARSIWYYFPVALSMKLSVPLLLLPLIVSVFQPRALLNWASLIAGCLLVHSLTCRVQIGIRFMLPLVAFLAIGLASALVTSWQLTADHRKRRVWVGGIVAGLVWTVSSAVTVWPHALCYTNALWGGTANGYFCLSDSNFDWGQGLKELAQWRDSQGLPVLDVWYFGTDAAIRDPGFRPARLHEATCADPQESISRVDGRFLAVSATLLYGAYGLTKNSTQQATPWQRMADHLRKQQPWHRTTTFFIFDLGREADRVAQPVVARHDGS